MAEAVKITHGDTLTNILKTRRGLKDHEIYTWLRKVRPLNPHIGDLNCNFPRRKRADSRQLPGGRGRRAGLAKRLQGHPPGPGVSPQQPRHGAVPIQSGRLPANLLVNIKPLRLGGFDIHYWRGERPLYLSHLQGMQPITREMFQDQGPENSYVIARVIEWLQEMGASVGLDDVLTSSASGLEPKPFF